MPNVAAFYTSNYNAGAPTQIYIGHSNVSDTHAEPVYDGEMRVVAEMDGRRLLCNDMTGRYWDDRPVHGRWGVYADDDDTAVAVWRMRRW